MERDDLELARQCCAERRVRQALELFDRAQAAGHGADDCAAGRWTCWMLLGRMEHAWRESDAIALRAAPDPHRFWDGEPLDGRRVMLRCLHGLGDTIQFIRYARELRTRVAHLIVEAQPKLMELLRGVDGIDQLITWGDAEPPWHKQIEVTELPRYFRTSLETIPAHVPYLRVPAAARERARLRMPSSGPRLRVGLNWAAGEWNAARSLSRDQLAPLASAGVWFYDLQFQPEAGITPTILDTAADILQLDLVVTVDTMVAHLAGALARPVWTLLPFEADWRWMLNRDDTPWYPTMRLFRQPRPGDWTSVIAAVAQSLRKAAPSPG